MFLGPKRKLRIHSRFILDLGNHNVETINFFFPSKILPRNLPDLLSVGESEERLRWVMALGLKWSIFWTWRKPCVCQMHSPLLFSSIVLTDTQFTTHQRTLPYVARWPNSLFALEVEETIENNGFCLTMWEGPLKVQNQRAPTWKG